jgi:polyhydroxybutyrate depolymerase
MVEKLKDKADDGMSVTKKTYRPKKGGAEFVLVQIDGGGHTWPGEEPPVGFIGKSTQDVVANDMMWEFFRRHSLP